MSVTVAHDPSRPGTFVAALTTANERWRIRRAGDWTWTAECAAVPGHVFVGREMVDVIRALKAREHNARRHAVEARPAPEVPDDPFEGI